MVERKIVAKVKSRKSYENIQYRLQRAEEVSDMYKPKVKATRIAQDRQLKPQQ